MPRHCRHFILWARTFRDGDVTGRQLLRLRQHEVLARCVAALHYRLQSRRFAHVLLPWRVRHDGGTRRWQGLVTGSALRLSVRSDCRSCGRMGCPSGSGEGVPGADCGMDCCCREECAGVTDAELLRGSRLRPEPHCCSADCLSDDPSEGPRSAGSAASPRCPSLPTPSERRTAARSSVSLPLRFATLVATTLSAAAEGSAESGPRPVTAARVRGAVPIAGATLSGPACRPSRAAASAGCGAGAALSRTLSPRRSGLTALGPRSRDAAS